MKQMTSSTLKLALCLGLLAGCAGNKAKDLSSDPAKAADVKAGSVGPGTKGAPILVGPDIIAELPVDEVWTVISDVENWGVWNPKVTQVKPGAGLNTGSKLDWHWEEKAIESEVTAIKEGELLEIKGIRSGSDASLRWTLRGMGKKQTLVSLRAVLKAGANATLIANAGNETQAWIAALQGEVAKKAAEAKAKPKKKTGAK